MKPLPRILQITEVSENGHISCVFNTGEYRIISLAKFADDHRLKDNAALNELIEDPTAIRQVQLVEGTLSFPSIQRSITLSNGSSFSVAYDLDPGMLYASSIPDLKREQANRIGGQLRAARKQAGITQEELAHRVGTSKGYISRIENDRSDIELSTLRRIVEVGLNKRLAITDR
jgi:DNA-binding XRE family transcriptional regulator